MRRQLLAGIVTLALLTGVTSFALASQRALFLKPRHEVTITYPDASGLVAGSDVLEAGAKVGTIDSIEALQGQVSKVTIQVDDDHWPLHQGVKAAIRPKSLLGEKYVDLQDGKPSAPAFDARQTIHSGTKEVPVELDQFISSLDPQTRASARVLIDDLGAGAAGQGRNLNEAIQAGTADLQHLATFGTTLNNRDPDLDRILVGLDGVLGRITTDDQLNQMSQLITNGQNTLNAIETEQAAFSRQFVDSQAAFSDFNVALNGAVPALHDTLSTLPHFVQTLQAETAQLDIVGTQFNTPLQLTSLVEGLKRGPTSTGGALEKRADGSTSAIFRICLYNPAGPGGKSSCTGNGFSDRNTPGNAVEASTQPGSSAGGDLLALAAFMGS
ncbi:MAG: MlaD family protein [Candidatus Dormibacteria bacterium]